MIRRSAYASYWMLSTLAAAAAQDITQPIENIMDVGIIGSVCALLIVLVIYRERYWHKEIKDIKADHAAQKKEVVDELKLEREKHDKTRETLLEETRSNGEALAAFMQEVKKNDIHFNTLMQIIRKEIAA